MNYLRILDPQLSTLTPGTTSDDTGGSPDAGGAGAKDGCRITADGDGLPNATTYPGHVVGALCGARGGDASDGVTHGRDRSRYQADAPAKCDPDHAPALPPMGVIARVGRYLHERRTCPICRDAFWGRINRPGRGVFCSQDCARRDPKRAEKFKAGHFVPPHERAEMIRAHGLINMRLRRGRLVKPERCEGCGKRKRLDGHHTDYRKPDEVQWLCRSCHVLAHRREHAATNFPIANRSAPALSPRSAPTGGVL